MSEKINKKGEFSFPLFMIIILIIFLFLFISIVFYKNTLEDVSCLEKIAKEECKNLDLYYDGVSWDVGVSLDVGWEFYCKENERSSSFKQFNFLEDELNKCKK